MNVLFFLKPKNEVAFIFNDNTLRQGIEKLRHYGFTAIPVIDREGRYAGSVTEGDFLWKLLDAQSWDSHSLEHFYVRDIIRPAHNPAVNVNASTEDLFKMAMTQNFVPVTDDTGIFIGIVTRRDILRHYYSLTHPEQHENQEHPEHPEPQHR